MSNHDTLRVELGARSYDILVGSNLLADTAKYIAPFVKKAGVVVISDAVVAKHHLATVLTSLDGAGIAHREVIVPSGEKSKLDVSLFGILCSLKTVHVMLLG